MKLTCSGKNILESFIFFINMNLYTFSRDGPFLNPNSYLPKLYTSGFNYDNIHEKNDLNPLYVNKKSFIV